jgi:hypothetical protein
MKSGEEEIITFSQEVKKYPLPICIDEIKSSNIHHQNDVFSIFSEDLLHVGNHISKGMDDYSGLIEANFAISHILHKLDGDCSIYLSSQIRAKDAPPSLSLPVVVEHSISMFNNLLGLLNNLVKEFYSASFEKFENLRMLSLLLVLRILHVNIRYLISWNVDPKICGFKRAEKPETPVSLPMLRRKSSIESVENIKLATSGLESLLPLQNRFVLILNRLITESPPTFTNRHIIDQIHSEVCEVLSVGMPVFFGLPADRVAILADLVDEILISHENQTFPNPMRLLLMTRYFKKVSEPQDVVDLMPAIT